MVYFHPDYVTVTFNNRSDTLDEIRILRDLKLLVGKHSFYYSSVNVGKMGIPTLSYRINTGDIFIGELPDRYENYNQLDTQGDVIELFIKNNCNECCI
jgi:hypothetical protein